MGWYKIKYNWKCDGFHMDEIAKLHASVMKIFLISLLNLHFNMVGNKHLYLNEKKGTKVPI